VDLSTPDVEAAAGFYRELLGWTIERSTTPMGEYLIGKVGDHEAAGMMVQGPEQRGMPAMWTTFLSVDEMDPTIVAVERAGGRVLEPPFEIPGGARVAVIADPTGAMLCLITGPKPGRPYFSQQPGAVCWVELLTRDPESAAAFYNEVFGWKADFSPDAEYTMFKLDDEDVAGMMTMPAEVPTEAPAHWAVYFAVGDCADTEKRTVELGGQVLKPTMSIEIGRFAVLADPHGAVFQPMEFAG
jgi:predicted enzyme related to lactoylglutathione lyase